MITIQILRFLQLLSFLVVATQLMYYLFVMGEALKGISINGFLEQRQVVDALVVKRLRFFYYTSLLLTLTVAVLTAKQPASPAFITSVIAFVCLVADIAIALKGNGPINALVNTWAPGQPTTANWEAVRVQWLDFIRYRGIISAAGLLSLLSAWVFRQ